MAYVELKLVEEMLENAQLISDEEYCGYCTEDINLYKLPVVEITRCSNCRLRGTEECPMTYYSEYEGEYVDPTNDNDFCSCGKPKN